MTASTDRIEHQPWCQPQPGEKQIRTEQYSATAGDGSTVIVHRCQECGEAHYTRLGQL